METVYHKCPCDAPLKLRLSYGTWGAGLTRFRSQPLQKQRRAGTAGVQNQYLAEETTRFGLVTTAGEKL